MRSQVACALALTMTGVVTPALAGGPKEATDLYTQGSEYAERNRCDQAIPLLERSYALLESPNTALLLGRCLRDTGSPEEAFVRYDVAVRQAQERVAKGELRYAATERVARSERDALRATMGTIAVRGLVGGDRVEVYRLRVDPGADGSVAIAVRPGATKARIHRAGSIVRELPVTVTAGSETVLEVPRETPEPAAPPPPPPKPAVLLTTEKPVESATPTWVPPVAIGSGVLAVLGIGSFTFFGLRSESVYSDLEACSPRCPLDRRDAADQASREQTFANVGLIAGSAFALIAAPLIVYWLSSSSSSQPKSSALR